MSSRSTLLGSALLFFSICALAIGADPSHFNGVVVEPFEVEFAANPVSSRITRRDAGDSDPKTTSTWTESSTIQQRPITVDTIHKEIIKTLGAHQNQQVTEHVITTWTVLKGNRKTVTQTVTKPPLCGWSRLTSTNKCLTDTDPGNTCFPRDWDCKCRLARKQVACFQHCRADERLADYRRKKRDICRQAYAMQGPQPLNPMLTYEVEYTGTHHVQQSSWDKFKGNTINFGHDKSRFPTQLRETVIEYPKGRKVTVWTGKRGHTHTPTVERLFTKDRKTFRTTNAQHTGAAVNFVDPRIAVIAGGALGLVAAAI